MVFDFLIGLHIWAREYWRFDMHGDIRMFNYASCDFDRLTDCNNVLPTTGRLEVVLLDPQGILWVASC
jgi:hypothetical protein